MKKSDTYDPKMEPLYAMESLGVVQSFDDSYREYLESQKEMYAQLLLSGEPISFFHRNEIAHLLCYDIFFPKKTRAPGRPKKSDMPASKDFRITLDYEKLYSKGCSDAVYLELQEKYGFKDRSSITKALANVRKFRKNRGYDPSAK